MCVGCRAPGQNSSSYCRAARASITLSPTKLAVEFAELRVEVGLAGWSWSWPMSAPPANGRVDAQQDSVSSGFFAVRGHLALHLSTWTDMVPNWLSFLWSLRGGSMTSMIAVCELLSRRVGQVQPPTATGSGETSHRLRSPTVRRLPSLFLVAFPSSALCPSRCVENDSTNFACACPHRKSQAPTPRR